MKARGFSTAFSILALLAATSASAADRKPSDKKSDWVAPTMESNGSFLNDLGRGRNDNAELLEKKSALELKQQYEDMVRDYDHRKEYDLTTNEEDRKHVGQVQDFSRNVFNTVQHQQATKVLENVRKNAERDPTISKMKKPAEVIAAGVAFYYGAPVKFKLGSESNMEAATNVPNHEGHLNLRSPFLNSFAEFRTDALSPDEEAKQKALDPTKRQERLRLGVNRGIPVLGLASGLTYGNSTRTVTASLSKQLTDSLSCVVDSMRPLEASTNPGEESLKFMYGIRF